MNCDLKQMNELGEKRIPFLFIINFDGSQAQVIPLSEVNPDVLLYDFPQFSNTPKNSAGLIDFDFRIEPVNFARYAHAFDLVMRHLNYGDSFLTNLTMPSIVRSKHSLTEIYFVARARYKLWLKDQFVVFSPETFVTIQQGIIRSFPMKGTIDASVPQAESKLLASEKELAEHYTIVDLIRNDLSMVAKNVRVERFRSIERIQTHRHAILQMSSQIAGDLPKDFHARLGDIFVKLLPAGSITGAPKKKTVEIIREAEQYQRGYYTGVMGVYDGNDLYSAVMIRFLEKADGHFIYKSGGGITVQSHCEEEYQELIDKIYVPLA